jgi:hypothetical protein
MRVMALLMGTATVVSAEYINLEESIPIPESVLTQYCAQGVEIFNDPGRIIEPSVGTSSPTHALTSAHPGVEFQERNEIRIAFTAGQSEISIQVGLDRNYPSIPNGVTAYLYAYDSVTADSGLMSYDATNLGNLATPISKRLHVISQDSDIRAIKVVFEGTDTELGLAIPAIEVIDDLQFETLGPPCGGLDTDPPQILWTCWQMPLYVDKLGESKKSANQIQQSTEHYGI